MKHIVELSLTEAVRELTQRMESEPEFAGRNLEVRITPAVGHLNKIAAIRFVRNAVETDPALIVPDNSNTYFPRTITRRYIPLATAKEFVEGIMRALQS